MIYRGTVLNNTGPYGQCKIYIPSIYPEVIDGKKPNETGYAERIPWAEPALPLFGGSTSNNGMCSVPKTGAVVWVFLEGGDAESPVYFACSPGNSAWTVPNDESKLDHHVIKTSGKLTIQASEINISSPKINMNVPEQYIEDDSGIDDVVQEDTSGGYTEENYKPHMMYDPFGNGGQMANTYEQHVQLEKLGFTHERPGQRFQNANKRPSNPNQLGSYEEQLREYNEMMGYTNVGMKPSTQSGGSGGSGGGSSGGGSGGGSSGGGGSGGY